jgi:hypothetical protein
MLFDFGQPTDGIIQMAFVVEDLDEAMRRFTDRLRIGPWTVLRNFAGDDPRYRGEPTQAEAHIALGFCGHMQYELIQPADDLPSVHRDVIRDRGYGFHHFGYATPQFDEKVEENARAGIRDRVQRLRRAGVPGGVLRHARHPARYDRAHRSQP